MPEYDPTHTYDSDGEILDVVDADNRVIGQSTRRDIHMQGLMHRSIHVFLLNPDRHLYLQKRAADKDTFAGAWDSSAAGHVDAGEAYDAAALRETQEELGLTTTNVDLVAVGDMAPTADNGMEHVRFYLARTTATPVPDPKEVAYGAFFTTAQVATLMADPNERFAPTFRHLFARYTTEFAVRVEAGEIWPAS